MHEIRNTKYNSSPLVELFPFNAPIHQTNSLTTAVFITDEQNKHEKT